ncbi:hypothetical protein [uncultured Phascolarctobacterium sp.]|uniref:hypothetical protein n=1 Tax=uncultured Phascolarctobacterium sp. TaxID=512296 RepID=UPI0025E171D4|nr:hypothetical protein [uncultured Phascolarctobacterium sp.]
MATKSILKNIVIKTPAAANKLANALELAEKRQDVAAVKELSSIRIASIDEVKKMFGLF